MKVIFMGTPEFAAEILQAVAACPVEVTAVFTQPDRPVGRKQQLTPPAVKTTAEALGIPVFQPERIKKGDWTERIEAMAPDLIVVAAYGQLLSQRLLDIPPLGCINIHGSLLPYYRGAAPIQWSVANGETTTGVTAMRMDIGMDTGDILLTREVPITDTDTAETMYTSLAKEGAILIREVIERLLAGEVLPRRPQPEGATYAPILKKEDGLLDWTWTTRQIDCRIRGFSPWPGTFTFWKGQKMMIEEAVPAVEEAGDEEKPGALRITQEKHPKLLVRTGDGWLQIRRLGLQGKKSMEAEAFLRGHDLSGSLLESNG
jgi:methionyl-tRNA formyltransferase